MTIPTIKTILYATALKPSSKRVFKYALSLARQYNAHVVMLHVIEPVGEMGDALIKKYIPEEMFSQVHDEGIKSIIDMMQKRVTLFVTEEIESLNEIFEQVIEPIVVEGRYVESILDQAEQRKADLIVMGTETRQGLGKRFITRHVIKNAKVPVIVVPTGKKHL